jgi:hypothetical protein
MAKFYEVSTWFDGPSVTEYELQSVTPLFFISPSRRGRGRRHSKADCFLSEGDAIGHAIELAQDEIRRSKEIISEQQEAIAKLRQRQKELKTSGTVVKFPTKREKA